MPVTTAPPVEAGGDRLDPGVQRVLDGCEGHIVESVTETDAQVRRSVSRIRAGDYGADDWVTDMSALTARAIRDGARSVLGQRDLLISLAKLAGRFGGQEHLPRGPGLPGHLGLPSSRTATR